MTGLISRLHRWWDWHIAAAFEPEEPLEPVSHEPVPAYDVDEDLDAVWWRYA